MNDLFMLSRSFLRRLALAVPFLLAHRHFVPLFSTRLSYELFSRLRHAFTIFDTLNEKL